MGLRHPRGPALSERSPAHDLPAPARRFRHHRSRGRSRSRWCSCRPSAPCSRWRPRARSETVSGGNRRFASRSTRPRWCCRSAVAIAVLALPHGHDLIGNAEPALPWLAVMLCAAALAFLTNIVLTSVVLALHEGIGAFPLVRKAVSSNLSTDGMLLALGPVFAITATRSPYLVPLLVVAVWNVYRAASSRVVRRQHEATHDALTDLPNRRQFFEHASLAHAASVRSGRAFAVAVLDLDGFKEINDRLGHQIGDLVLQEVALRLRGRATRHGCRGPARRGRVRDPPDRRRRNRRRARRDPADARGPVAGRVSSAGSRSRSTAVSASRCTPITGRASSC